MSQTTACPVCGNIDASAIILSLISSQTQITTGKSYDLNKFGLRENPFFASTEHRFQSESVLVKRLSPPGKPWPKLGRYFWIGLGLCIILDILLDHGAWFVGILFGLVAGFLANLMANWKSTSRAWTIHAARLGQYAGSYYCSRDDVCFMPGYPAQRPESFQAWLFQY
jgi:hypothetical protein